MVRWHLVLAGGVLLAGGLPVRAAEKPADDAIARNVIQLADPDPAVRQAAVQKLFAAGDSARPALQAAAADTASEIGSAARDMLRDFDVGIRPETPPELVALVRRYQEGTEPVQAEVVKQLTQKDADGYILLSGLLHAQPPSDRPTAQVIFGDAARTAPYVAARLTRDGRAQAALRVLRMPLELGDVDGARHWATLAALLGQGESAVAAVRASIGDPSGNDAAAELIQLIWYLSGKPAEALKIARLRPNVARLEIALASTGDWKELAASIPADDLESQPPARWAMAALAHRMADSPAQAQVADQIQRLGRAGGNAEQPAAQALLLMGRPDAALQVFTDPAKRAAMLVELGRLPEAIEIYNAMAKEPARPPVPAPAGVIADTSLDPHGWRQRLARRAARLRLGLPPDASDALPRPGEMRDLFDAQDAVVTLAGMGLRRPALELGASLVNRLTVGDERSIFTLLYRERGSDASRLLHWQSTDIPHGPELTEAILKIDRTMRGQATPSELSELTNKLLEATDDLARVSTLVPTVCRILRESGQVERVRKLLLQASHGRFSLNGLKGALAEELLRVGEYAPAAALFEEAAKADPDPVLRYLWAGCLERSQQLDRGKAIGTMAWLMSSANVDQRLDAAEVLLDDGMPELARRELQTCAQMAVSAPLPASTALDDLAALDYHAGDYTGAAELAARAMVVRLSAPEQSSPNARAIRRLTRCRALAAIRRGRRDLALRDLDEAIAMFPHDPAALVDAIAPMRQAGWTDPLAERIDRWVTTQETFLEKYPGAGGIHAALAIVLIHDGRTPDKAAAHLQTASRLMPDASLVRLALAEQALAKGDRAAAVAAITPLIRDDPSNRELVRARDRLQHGRLDDPWAPW